MESLRGARDVLLLGHDDEVSQVSQFHMQASIPFRHADTSNMIFPSSRLPGIASCRQSINQTHCMKKIAIVYFSGTGHTAQMAEAVCKGASGAPGVQASLLPIDGRAVKDGRFQDDNLLSRLAEADAIIFGSPTYMGGAAGQFKAFADATGGIWHARQWKDKLAAGFTHSGSPSGDKLATLQYFSVLAAQHGMIWIGNAEPLSNSPDGLQINRVNSSLGVMGYGNHEAGAPPQVDPGDLRTADSLGLRVATFVQILNHNTQPATL